MDSPDEKFASRLSRVIRLAGPIAILIFTAVHGLGLLEKWPWLEINFAAVGLWFTAMVLEFSIENREAVEKLGKLTEEARQNSLRVSSQMENLQSEIHRSQVHRLDDLRRTIDPEVDAIVGPFLDEHIAVLKSALGEELTLELDQKKFHVLYRATLAAFPRATFYATSYPSARYFWNNNKTEDAMRTFIRDNGHMQRIFFLRSAAEAQEPDVNLILSRQREIQVQVQTLVKDSVPLDWQKIFLVESRGRIGWELTLSPDLDIEKARVTWNREKTDELCKRFKKLWSGDLFEGRPWRDPNLSEPGAPDVDRFERYEHQEWERSGVATAYDHYFGTIARQAAEQLLKTLLAGREPKGKLLDVASGPGYFAAAAKSKGMEVVAVDFSASVVGLGQDRDNEIGFRIGNAAQLDFADQQFDLVGINLGVMHFARPELAFREAFRVLKPGGRFGFTAWSLDSQENSVIGIVQNVIETLGEASVKPPDGPPYFRYGETAYARTALEAVGFSNVHVVRHELLWKLQRREDLFAAFAEGTARMGGRIRAQIAHSPSIGEAIRERVIARAAAFETPDHQLRIPMPYMVITAERGS